MATAFERWEQTLAELAKNKAKPEDVEKARVALRQKVVEKARQENHDNSSVALALSRFDNGTRALAYRSGLVKEPDVLTEDERFGVNHPVLGGIKQAAKELVSTQAQGWQNIAGSALRLANDFGKNEKGTWLDQAATSMEDAQKSTDEFAGEGYATADGVRGFGKMGLQNAPILISTYLTGGAAAGATSLAGRAAGLAKTAQEAAKVAKAARYAGAAGAAAAGFSGEYGDARQQTLDKFKDITPEQMRESEKYAARFKAREKELYLAGAAPEDAAKQAYEETVDALSETDANIVGVVNSMIEFVAPGASKFFLGGGKLSSKSLANAKKFANFDDVKDVLKQFGQEFLQEGFTSAVTDDTRAKAVNGGVNWGQVGKDALVGGTLGAIMGGGVQFATGESTRQRALEEIKAQEQQQQGQDVQLEQAAQNRKAELDAIRQHRPLTPEEQDDADVADAIISRGAPQPAPGLSGVVQRHTQSAAPSLDAAFSDAIQTGQSPDFTGLAQQTGIDRNSLVDQFNAKKTDHVRKQRLMDLAEQGDLNALRSAASEITVDPQQQDQLIEEAVAGNEQRKADALAASQQQVAQAQQQAQQSAQQQADKDKYDQTYSKMLDEAVAALEGGQTEVKAFLPIKKKYSASGLNATDVNGVIEHAKQVIAEKQQKAARHEQAVTEAMPHLQSGDEASAVLAMDKAGVTDDADVQSVLKEANKRIRQDSKKPAGTQSVPAGQQSAPVDPLSAAVAEVKAAQAAGKKVNLAAIAKKHGVTIMDVAKGVSAKPEQAAPKAKPSQPLALPAPQGPATTGDVMVSRNGKVMSQAEADALAAASDAEKKQMRRDMAEEAGNPTGIPTGMKPKVEKPARTEQKAVLPHLILRTDGKPFPDEKQANRVLASKKLTETHEVVSVDGGKAIAPKDSGKESAIDETNRAFGDWYRANKSSMSEELTSGGILDGIEFRNLPADIRNRSAHGMAKDNTLRSLRKLLNNGIDTQTEAGGLFTAILSPTHANAGAGSGTASGSAYTDGPFILVGKPGVGKITDISQIDAIVVNRALPDGVLEGLQNEYPDFKFVRSNTLESALSQKKTAPGTVSNQSERTKNNAGERAAPAKKGTAKNQELTETHEVVSVDGGKAIALKSAKSGLVVKNPATGSEVGVDSIEDAARKFSRMIAETGADPAGGMDVFDASTGQPVANVKADGTWKAVETREQARERSERAVAMLNEEQARKKAVTAKNQVDPEKDDILTAQGQGGLFDAPATAEPGPGSDAGNGFKHGPQAGERYRVGQVSSVGGAIALEKRLPAGTDATFYVGVDGILIDGDDLNLISNESRSRLWIPASSEQASQALHILDEMGRLALSDPRRAEMKRRLKSLVTNSAQPTQAPWESDPREAYADQNAQADAERDTFTLTGSDRPDDVAMAAGQKDLFAPRTRGEKAAEKSQPKSDATISDADYAQVVEAAKYLKDIAYSMDNLVGDDTNLLIALSSDLGKSGRDTILMDAFGIDRSLAHTINNKLDDRKPHKLRDVDMEDAFTTFPMLRKVVDDAKDVIRKREERRSARDAESKAASQQAKDATTDTAESKPEPVKWFGSRDKAEAWIAKNGPDYYVVQAGPSRFEVFTGKKPASPVDPNAFPIGKDGMPLRKAIVPMRQADALIALMDGNKIVFNRDTEYQEEIWLEENTARNTWVVKTRSGGAVVTEGPAGPGKAWSQMDAAAKAVEGKTYKADLRGKAVGNVLTDAEGALYRIESLDDDGTIILTKNPGMPKESRTRIQQDRYDRILAEDADVKDFGGKSARQDKASVLSDRYAKSVDEWNRLSSEYKDAKGPQKESIRMKMDALNREQVAIKAEAYRNAEEERRLASAKIASEKYGAMGIGTKIGIIGHDGNDSIYWEKTGENQWSRRGIGSTTVTITNAEMEGSREIAPAEDLDSMFDDVLAEVTGKPKAEPVKQERTAGQEPVESAFTGEPDSRNSAPMQELAGFAVGDKVSIANRSVSEGVIRQLFTRQSAGGEMSMARVEVAGGKTLDLLTDNLSRQERTAGQAAVSAAKNTGMALGDAIDGLGKLFGGKGTLGSGLVFDEETYAKAKPYFIAAIAHLRAAGGDLREAMRAVVKMVVDKFGVEAAENMKPYVVQFISDVRDGKIDDNAAGDAAGKSLTDTLYQRLKNGTLPKDNNGLRKLVAEFDGGEVDNTRLKVAQENLEAAIVMYSRDIAAAGGTDKEIFSKLLDVYSSQPNLNIRTSTSMENQAYSTPAPLAFLASRLAGINGNTVVLEPTAGTGMLLMGADPKNSFANELNPDRADILRAQGFNPTTKDAATDELVPAGKKIDSVITNPPFGSVKDADGKATKVSVDGYRIGKIDHLIAARALDAMSGNGKATLIIGADKVAGGVSTDDRIFFNWLYSHYNVTGHFEIDGDLYKRQGAGWPVRVITINGRARSSNVSPMPGTVQRVNNWSEVYDQYSQVLGAQNSGTESGVVTGSESTGQSGNDAAAAQNTDGQESGGVVRQRNRTGGKSGPSNVGGTSAGTVRNQQKGTSEKLADSSNVQRPDERTNAQDQLEPGDKRGVAPAGRNQGNAGGADAAKSAGGALVDADNAFQTKYIPRSARKDDGVLVPINMAQPTQDSLSVLEDAVGDIDQYAAKELGYDSAEELHDALMGLQVDSVASAIYQIKERGKGVIIADQTGIGKGRQAAAIIRWSHLNGYIPVFVTVKPSLFTDMYNDLADIGSNDIEPFIVNKDEWISSHSGDRMFTNKQNTHGKTLQKIANTGLIPEGRNAIFVTYSQINKDNVQRNVLNAVAPNAVFILDESHNAGGESGTGDFIRSAIAPARGVTYLSATFAKRPDNMPLYFRTDIGDAIGDGGNLMSAMESGGLPLQTVVSNNLVSAGQMFRRERSYDGVNIDTIIDTENRDAHEKLSDAVTEALRKIVAADRAFHNRYVRELKKQMKALGSSIEDSAGNNASESVDHTEFSSVVHNFIRQMLLGMKADTAANEAIAAIKRGDKPLLALENTMGSFLNEYAANNNLSPGQSLGDFDYRTVLSRALDKSRYIIFKDDKGNKEKQYVPLDDLDSKTRDVYDEAQSVIDGLDINIPVSPLDWMRYRIEEAGYTVAEITGRELAVDYSKARPVLTHVPASERMDKVNTTRMFNDGRLDAIILNVAGSTGISLHASEKFKDQRKRHMIVVQPAQDINIFMQMLGRIHRTGQVKLPSYAILNADLPTEKRPTALLNKKMKSLNANTSSNTESATSIKSQDMLNKYGDQVIGNYLLEHPELAMEIDAHVDEDGVGKVDLSRTVTGRMALMPVSEQKDFYTEVEDQYNNLIEYLNETNQNELEPRTFDFEAEVIEEATLVEATDPTSPFGQEAVYGEYKIKAQGKQMTPDEVKSEYMKHLSGKTGAGFAEDMVNDLLDRYAAQLNASRRAHGLGKTLDAEKYEAWLKRAFGYGVEGSPTRVFVDTELKRAIDAYAAGETIVDFTRKNVRTAETKQGVSFIEDHEIGSAWRVDINGDVYNAVITNVRNTHKGVGSPFSMSKIQVTLAVNGPIRTITIPASQWNKVEVAKLYIGWGVTIEGLFRDQVEGSGRAKIITGNLLAAYGELKDTKGTIVNFTKKDGSIAQGILLPRKFDFKTNTRGDFMFRTAADAFKFLSQSLDANVGRFGISSRDAAIRVIPVGGGIKIIVPKSKARGGKYFLDKKLIAMVGDFVSDGNGMVVRVNGAKASEEALKYLMVKSPLYAIPSLAEEARSILGLPPAGAKLSVGEGSGPGLTTSRAREILSADPVLSKAMPFIDIRNSKEGVPEGAEPFGEEGYYHNGRITLFADNIRATGSMSAEERLKWVAFHEITHRGVANLAESQEYMAELQRAGKNPFIKNLAKKIYEKRQKLPPKYHVTMEEAIEEALAEANAALQTGSSKTIKEQYGLHFPLSIRPRAKSAVARFFEAVKRIFNRMFGRGLTDAQVENLLRRTNDAGMTPDGGPGRGRDYDAAVFSLADNGDGSPTEAALAEARRQLEEQLAIADRMIAERGGLFAPNGEKSKLNRHQWAQVRTANFRKWFGDWEGDAANSSKVIDANGEPLVVYHGTVDLFPLFERKGGYRTGFMGAQRPVESNAFFFTGNRSLAYAYARNKQQGDKSAYMKDAVTIPTFLRAVNPLDMRKMTPALKKILTNAGFVFEKGDTAADMWRAADDKDVVLALRTAGYDGFLINEKSAAKGMGVSGDTSSIAVLDPNQIKSATGNAGTFSGKTDDIRYSAPPTPGQSPGRSVFASVVKQWMFQKWTETLGTQLNTAMLEPLFKPTYQLVQRYLQHTSNDAYDAISVAPNLLGRLEDINDYGREIKNIGKFKKINADRDAAAVPLFEGTRFDKKVYSDAVLKRVYNLTDDQVAVYREARAAIEASLDSHAKSVITKILLDAGAVEFSDIDTLVNRDPPADDYMEELRQRLDADILAANDAIAIQKTALSAAGVTAQDKASIQASIKKGSRRVELLEEAAKRIDSTEDTLSQLKREGYFPLMRWGKYTVTVKDAGGNVVDFRMVETLTESEKLEAALTQQYHGQGMTVEKGSMSENRYKNFAGISPETLALFAKEWGVDNDEAYQEYLKLALPGQSALKRRIHRKGDNGEGIAGFSTDIQRTLAAFVMGNARHSARNIYGSAITQAVEAIPKNKGTLYDIAFSLAEFVTNPDENSASVSIRNMLFIWNMGASVAFGALNLTQPWMMTLPWLSQFSGIGSVVELMGKAAKTAAIAQKNGTVPQEYYAEYQQAVREGHVDPQNVFMLQGIERGGSGLGSSLLKTVSHGMGMIAAATESYNRKLTLFAALDVARAKGLPWLKSKGFDSAYAFAVQAVAETQGVYNKGNRPAWARGPIGAVLLVFKQYAVNWIEMAVRMGRNHYGDDRMRKGLMMMLGLLFAMAGGMGMPFAEDLKDIAETAMGSAGKPVNIERQMQMTLGKGMADTVLAGPINAMVFNSLGLDMHGRMSMGNLIPGTGALNPYTSTDAKLSEGISVMGAGTGLLKKASDSIAAAQDGRIVDAVQHAAPRSVESFMKGVRMMAEGKARDARGNVLMETTPWDAAAKMIDFQPASVAITQRERGRRFRDKNIQMVARKSLRDRLITAYEEKDAEKIRDAEQALDEWNQDNPLYQIKLKKRDLRKAAKKRGSSWLKREETPKGLEWTDEYADQENGQ